MSGLSNAMNGASLKFTDTALVQQYANSIKGLNLQQAQLALSTKILSDEQKEQILVQAGLKASEDAIQGELLQTTLIQKGLNDEKIKAILISAGVMDADTEELIADKACTKADLEAALAQELKNKTDERGILKTLGLGNANIFTGETFKLLTKSIWENIKAFGVWLTTTPVGILTLIAGSITAIGIAVVNYDKKLEENRQEMIETGKEASQLTKDLDGLAEQYRKLGSDGTFDNSDREQAYNIQQQINELLGDEVDYINLANGKYEDQIKLLQRLQYEKADEKYADIKDAKQAAENSLTYNAERNDVDAGAIKTIGENQAIEKLLKDSGMEDYIGQYNGDPYRFFHIDRSSNESIIESYEKMVELKSILAKSYEDEISSGGVLEDFYNNLCKSINNLSESVQKYKDALNDYNLNQAVIDFNETKFGGVTGATIQSEKAMNKWITSMMKSKDVTDGVQTELIALAKTWYPQYISQIDEAVESQAKSAVQSALQDKAIGDNIDSLKTEATALGITEQKMIELLLAEIRFNNNNLSVSQKIDALKELALWAGVAGETIDKIFGVNDNSNMSEKEVWAERNGVTINYGADTDGSHTYTYKGKTYSGVNGVNAVLADEAIQGEIKTIGAVDGGTTKATESTKQFKNRIDKITQSLEEYTKQLELLKKAQDDLYEDDHIGKLDYINKRYEVQSQYTADAKKELDALLSNVPTSAEGWENLATAVEKVSQQYFESRRAMIDYGVEMAETYMNAAKAVGEFSNALIDESTSQYDRNVKMLTEGGLGGLQFSLTPVVPEDAVERQRKENEELLKEEEIYQEKVNKIKRRALDEQLKSTAETVATIGANTTKTADEVKSHINKNIEELGQKAIDTYEMVGDHMKNYPWVLKVDDSELTDFWKKGTNYSVGNFIVEEAKKYLGTPYAWGGETPNGFDCSGLVQYVLDKAGYGIPRASHQQYKSDDGKPVDKLNLQPGDLVFFIGDGGTKNSPGHVGIYVGDGQYIHAPKSGDVVKISNLDDRKDYVGARRFYASGTKDYGIAGENYKREYLINKKTGEWTEVNSPTLIDTNEVDVVGEKASAKINKPLPMYADGTLSNSELLSIIKRVSEESGIPANVLMAVAQQETGGKWYDKVADGTGYSYGYMMLYDNGVIADLKAQGRNETAERAKTDPYTNVSVAAEYLKKFYEQGGNWKYAFGRYNGSGTNGEYARKVYERMNSSEYIQAAQNIGSIADDTKYIRRDFATQIKDIINGSTAIAGSEGYEDNLLAHIIENTSKSNKSAENFVANFEKLNAYQKEMEGYFAERDKELLASVGTPEFAIKRDEIAKEVSDYTNAIMGMSVDMETSQIKEQYEYSQALYDSAIAFYNKKKSEGASAEELAAYANGINKIKTQVNELSDAYVDVIQKETEFLKTQANNKMKSYDDDLSWVEQSIEDAEYNDDVAGQIVGYQNSNKILANKKNAAHQGVLDLYKNEEYAPIFERFDIESWFDSNGETTAKFAEDIARMGMSKETSHLVPLMQQIAEQVGIYKQNWYEADEAIKENAKSIADLKIEEHLNSLDFNAKIKDATINAKQSLYDFMDTLRDEERSITAELKANMQIDDWLTKDTRRLLFNEEDYAKQMDTINGLREEANNLYAEYQKQINSLGEHELWQEQAITDEYNRQMGLLKDKLDIANKELKLAKDKAAFENALLERDTQIIMGNRVQNVADPERLRDLAQTVAESELDLNDATIDKTQNDDIRMLEGERSAIQSRIDMINEMTALERLAYAERLGLDGNYASAVDNDKPNEFAIDSSFTDEQLSALGAKQIEEVTVNGEKHILIHDGYEAPEVAGTIVTDDGSIQPPTLEESGYKNAVLVPADDYLSNWVKMDDKELISKYTNGDISLADVLNLSNQNVPITQLQSNQTTPMVGTTQAVDNSIVIENVTLTLEDTPNDPSKFVTELATKIEALRGITKNK